MIKVLGEIFYKEHSKCMSQVPSSSDTVLKISAASTTFPVHVLGMPFYLLSGEKNFKPYIMLCFFFFPTTIRPKS